MGVSQLLRPLNYFSVYTNRNLYLGFDPWVVVTVSKNSMFSVSMQKYVLPWAINVS